MIKKPRKIQKKYIYNKIKERKNENRKNKLEE